MIIQDGCRSHVIYIVAKDELSCLKIPMHYLKNQFILLDTTAGNDKYLN